MLIAIDHGNKQIKTVHTQPFTDVYKRQYLACAFGMAASRGFYSVRYIRLPDLLVEISVARANGTYRDYMKKLRKEKLLILDEWLLYPLKEAEARDVLELVEARNKVASTIFCSCLLYTSRCVYETACVSTGANRRSPDFRKGTKNGQVSY